MSTHADRYTLAAVTAGAVLAATTAATWIPAWLTPGGLLTWAITYLAATLGLARLAHLPPARTLWASTLLLATALRVTLACCHQALGLLMEALDRLALTGTARLQKAAP